MQSAILGVSVFLLIIVLGKGNFLILAGPLSLWTVVISLPKTKDRMARQHPVRPRRMKKQIKHAKHWGAWRFYFTAAVWMTTAIIMWHRICNTTISEAETAAAMDRASLLFKEGRYEESLACFWVIEVPECFPKRRAQKYHNIGLIQLKLGNKEEAKTALQKAVSYDPKDMDAYYVLAHIAFDSKQYSKAKQYLHDAESQIQNGTSLPEPFRILKTELNKFQNGL